jgi:hypothetical protein
LSSSTDPGLGVWLLVLIGLKSRLGEARTKIIEAFGAGYDCYDLQRAYTETNLKTARS